MSRNRHAVPGSLGIVPFVLALVPLTAPQEARLRSASGAPGHRQGAAATQAQETLFRYRFEERVELPLDGNRIAAWAPGGMGPVLPDPFVPDGLEALPVQGWYLLTLRTPVTAGELPFLLEGLAHELGCEYVSPVFVDDLGGPLVPTPEILLQFAANVPATAAESVLRRSAAGEIVDRDWAGMTRAYRLHSRATSGLEVLERANALAQRADVRFAEPDFLFTGHGEQQAMPDDPMLARSWAPAGPGFFDYCYDTDSDMNAAEAWGVTIGDPNVQVLVLDVGVDPTHPDLNLAPGADFTGQGGGGAPVNDCDNHGTRVAGCIAMIAGNGLGSVGIAPGCKVAPARTFISNTTTCNGAWNGNGSWTVDALQWAQDNGIWITNNSNAYGFTSAAIEAKYEDTRNAGMVHFASAGNSATNPVGYPANLPTVSAVGALTPYGYVSPYSSSGPDLDFVAPGLNIFTTDRVGALGWGGDYGLGSGTSFASPFVAGIAALLRSADPELSPDAILARLRDSALDLGEPGHDPKYGWGAVDAGRALTMPGKIRPGPALPGFPVHQEWRRTCDRPWFSDDGRFVAFRSRSEDLVPGDTNEVPDVFVRDLQTGVVTRVSVDSSGNQASSSSQWPTISGDGRFVAFDSQDPNLVPLDTNGRRDVFLHDTLTSVTTRISVATGGAELNGNSQRPRFSADGRFIAFSSYATNLPAANGKSLIYVHDRVLGTTTLASRSADGLAADGHCYFPSISDDGQRVAFYSNATNLVAGANGVWHAYVADLATSSCLLASVDTAGVQSPSNCLQATISGDGNRVSFWTSAALDPADTNGLYDVYVRDLAAGTTFAGSTDASGAFQTRDTYGLQLSYDGRYLVLLTNNPLVAGDTNGHIDAYRKDLLTGALERVSVGPGGQQAWGGSTQPWISADGDQVGFVCDDDDLTPGDACDGYSDVYLRTISTATTVLATGGS
jgi:Tol biopolymer transport system component